MMERYTHPFTCYFCNQRIENDTEMVGHTSICGNVLVPCPYKCGSYIPRMEMMNHKKECVNRPSKSMSRLPLMSDGFDSGGSLDRRNGKEAVDRLQIEFQKLSTRMANFELQRTANFREDHQDLERMKYQNNLFLEWRKAVDFKVETLQQAVNMLENGRSENEYKLMTIQQKLSHLDKIRTDLDLSIDNFLKEQNYNRQIELELMKDFDSYKVEFQTQTNLFGSLLDEQKTIIEDLKSEMDSLRSSLDELKTKNISVIFDIKTISQISSETYEKLEIQEREFSKFQENFEQLRLDLEFLEDLASADAKISSTGHLIWKISDFEAKMAKAKESTTVLKSPIFYTHDFGYKIRILVYLNGLKKWRDRYCLISIHVVKGDFDPLLKWPCFIDGVLTLRDQENFENPKNFSKRIIAKRQTGDEENEEPQESSMSYIFIPHSTLAKSHYLKNDAIYFEMKVDKSKRIETTL